MARTIVVEGVKTIREARREVDRCHDTLMLAAEEVRRPGGEVVNFGQSPAGAGRVGWWERRPLGVVVGNRLATSSGWGSPGSRTGN